MGIYKIDDIKELKHKCTKVPDKIEKYLAKIKSGQGIKFGQNKNEVPFNFEMTIVDILNKINYDNYNNVVNQFNDLCVNSKENISILIKIILNKVIIEEKYVKLYAQISKHFIDINIRSCDDETVTFKKMLLEECRLHFLKYTSDFSFEKRETMNFSEFLIALHEKSILSFNVILSCVHTLVIKANHNNNMVDMLIVFINNIGKKIKTCQQWQTMCSEFNNLCESSKISIREKILLEDALSKINT